jgi:hypothetical protein
MRFYYYYSICCRHNFFSYIYLIALRGLTAIFLTVSIISSRGAIAAFSRSLEKTMVVIMRRMQMNRVLPMLTAAPTLLYHSML